MKRLRDYLRHIVEACDRISAYTHGLDKDMFTVNILVQDAVIRNFEIIGEASRNILRHHPDMAGNHPQIAFQAAYEMRNALSHGLFSGRPGNRLADHCR